MALQTRKAQPSSEYCALNYSCIGRCPTSCFRKKLARKEGTYPKNRSFGIGQKNRRLYAPYLPSRVVS